MRDFEFKAKCLGIENDPAILEILNQIKQETFELETLWEEQKTPGYSRKWWQDGEYNTERADTANDKGLSLFKEKKYGDAFHAFTEAIRLCPTSSVFHSNRSAAALRIKKADIAAQDAENALERNPQNVKALLRAGQAYIELKNPKKAEFHFKRALEVDTVCITAKRGLVDVQNLENKLEQQEAADQAASDAGTRPALLRKSQSLELATLQLISADQVLSTSPTSQPALLSKIEALIVCTRYSDALVVCEQLRSGLERTYLEAEAWWRDGNVSKALEKLQEIFRIKNHRLLPDKFGNLQEFLIKISESLDGIEARTEEGIFQDVIEICTELLESLDPGACCGLYRLVLRHRANASASRRLWKEARSDLDTALEMQQSDVEALRLRADLNKQTKKFLEYFLDVQRLKKVSPDAPGLGELLQDAARLCSSSESSYKENGTDKMRLNGSGPLSAYKILGVKPHAEHAEIRKAYLKLAAECHPDKWAATGSKEERSNAEERFKKIQAAYEELKV